MNFFEITPWEPFRGHILGGLDSNRPTKKIVSKFSQNSLNFGPECARIGHFCAYTAAKNFKEPVVGMT